MHFDDLPNLKQIVICTMLNVQKVSEKIGYWMLRSNPLSSNPLSSTHREKVRKSMASMQSEAYKLARPWNGLPKERTIGPAMPKRDG
jgi:hypothetical protein